MAKFRDLSLDLETGEHIDFDDDDTIIMGYDGDELYLTSTLSGVRAVEGYHMVRYDQLTESSGTLQDQIDDLNITVTGTNNFLDLTDTPNTYSGSENYLVVVNPAGDELIFTPQDEIEFKFYQDSVYVGNYTSQNFIGAVVSGSATVSGAVDILFADTVANVLDAYYGEVITEASTTSTSFQQRMRLTFTAQYSSEYLINFSTMISHEDTGVFCKLRLEINDTDTYKESWLELYNYKYSDGAYQIWSGSFAFTAVSGTSYDVDMDYCTGDSGKAMYIKESSMAVQRILTVM